METTDEEDETNDLKVDVNISIVDIMSYIGDGKRMLQERQQVFKAKHIVFAGSLNTKTIFEVVAICLRSTTPGIAPHQINLKHVDKAFTFWKIMCSCKGGSNGRCKHSVAALFHLFACTTLSITSCTEVAQSWGKLAAKKNSEYYIPKPINQLCCTKPQTPFNYELESELKSKLFNILLSCNSDSSLYKHVQGRSSNELIVPHEPELNLTDDEDNQVLQNLRVAFHENYFLLNLQRAEITITNKEQEEFYNTNVVLNEDESIQLCKVTKLQNTTEWFLERKKRITASKCYELYTYFKNKKPNWTDKIQKLISRSSLKIPNLKYGIETEKEAREWYAKCLGKPVEQLGFVVHPHASFLGCSPDGCCFKEKKLIEIKCAVEGDTKPLSSVLPHLKYLSYSEGIGYTLKEKHVYYGQIQLNMLILNFSQCDLIVYGKFSKCGYIINVKFNEIFAKQLYQTLHQIYFNYYLPVLCNM